MLKITGADRAAGPGGNAAQWTSAILEKVIHTRFGRGSGTADDPHRMVDAWFTLDGELIAEHDSAVRR